MLVVNFFGAPSSGKTTLAMEMAVLLKKQGFNAQYISEVAKDYIWRDASHLLKNQNLVFALQEEKQAIMQDKVEILLTDAPLLNGSFYAPKDYFKSFHDLCLETFNGYKNINFFVLREHPFEPQGRLQNEEDCNQIEKDMQEFLKNKNVKMDHFHKSTENLDNMKNIIIFVYNNLK